MLSQTGPVSFSIPSPSSGSLRFAPFATAAALAALGVAALFGWWIDIEALRCLIPGSLPLKPNIAAGFLFCGIALGCSSLKKRPTFLRLVASVLAITVMSLAVATLGEHFLNWNLGIDEWLVRSFPASMGSSHPGRMMPTTAFCFLLGGCALLLESRQTSKRLVFALIGGLSATLIIIGIAALSGFALEELFGPKLNLLGMSITGVSGAIGVLFLGGGLLALLYHKCELNWSMDVRTTFGFLVAIVLTVVTTAASFSFARQMLEMHAMVAHRQEVLKEIQQAVSEVSQLASSERAYVIIGDTSLLSNREQLGAQLKKDLGDVRTLTKDNPAQQHHLVLLESLIAQRIAFEDTVIAAGREQGLAIAAQMIATRVGINLTDQLSKVFAEMQNDEYRLLEGDRRNAQMASTATFMLLPMGVFLSIAILSLAVFFLNAGLAERAEAEARLRASLREVGDLKTALDEHAIVAVTDARGKITYANDKFCVISKFSREELIGQDHRIVNSGHHPKEFIRGLWQTIARGHTWKAEMKNRAKDGSYYWVDTTIVPFLNEKGKPHHYVVIRADITERKRIEEEIWQLNAQLEQRVKDRTAELEASNKELEAFSYSVSHDLRAPLRAVDGFSQAVLEDYADQLPPEGRNYLQTIRNGAQRMGALIDDLLTFSRLGRQPLKKGPTAPAALVRDALEELGSPKNGRKIDIRVDDLPPCQADPGLLKQVWMNLLSNAIRYTGRRDKARIEVGSKFENSEHVYFVADNGVGFDMQDAHKLFGVFQRLHRTEEFEGTGVGLATAQRIVHRHGGRIRADSTPGHGATFCFTLGEATRVPPNKEENHERSKRS